MIKRSGKCSGVKLEIQGVEMFEEFMLFDLGMTYVVLGYS